MAVSPFLWCAVMSATGPDCVKTWMFEVGRRGIYPGHAGEGTGMYQSTLSSRGDSPVSVIGAGIAGAWQALMFAQAGHAVTLHERSDRGMTQSTSYWAGGMLAPWCEAETSEPLISRLGVRSLELWREQFPKTPFNGSLVNCSRQSSSERDRKSTRLNSSH